MRLVIDASVVVKRVFPEAEGEDDAELALLGRSQRSRRGASTLCSLRTGWRESGRGRDPITSGDRGLGALDLLDAMELPVVNDPAIFKRASRLSR